ncbi:FAD binding domain-containing protein [Sarocladium implicatum]|nr:FAD binding domain-containing protein [Sarocladium implicatum]
MAGPGLVDFKSTLPEGYVLFPGDSGYDEALKRWSATCVKPAAAVFLPRSSQDVARMLEFAVTHKIPFNVKGGGHSTSQTSSAPSPAGVVIDLSHLRDVSVDASKQTVTFGGGCLWSDINDALAEHGLATPGGAVSHTGVGGLILHGGYGVLSGLHGLSIDNLISCEVVLADQSIVTASETENKDLFWALRGAGSSFGVVTSFTLKAYPQGQVYVGFMIFPLHVLPPLVDFLNHWEKTTDGNQVVTLSATYAPLEDGQAPPPEGRPPILIMVFGHFGVDAETAGPEYFKSLLDLKSEAFQSTFQMMPYPVVNTLQDTTFPQGRRYLFGGTNFTLPTTTEKVKSTIDLFLSLYSKQSGLADSVLSYDAVPTTAIRKVPVSATAFNNRGPYYNLCAVLNYTDPELDTVARATNRVFLAQARVAGYNDAEAKDGVGRYVNYMSDEVAPEEAFGGHTKRLKELKERYDPENVFDKLWRLTKTATEQYVV